MAYITNAKHVCFRKASATNHTAVKITNLENTVMSYDVAPYQQQL